MVVVSALLSVSRYKTMLLVSSFMIGHINHSLFWKNLSPASEVGGSLPSGGPLEKALVKAFGTVEEFKKRMNTVTAAIQGSGWGWLVCCRFSEGP